MDKKTIYNAICELDEAQLNDFHENCNKVKKQQKRMRTGIVGSVCLLLVAAGVFSLSAAGVFSKNPKAAHPQSAPSVSRTQTQAESGNTSVLHETTEKTTQAPESEAPETAKTESRLPSKKSVEVQTESPDSDALPPEIKGGNTPEFLRKHSLGPDLKSYYEVFFPEEDTFAPLQNMTLEARFSSFKYNGNGVTYCAAPDGEITPQDYEPELLDATIAHYFELRNPDADVVGIEYRARMDIYKLKGVDPGEAVACVISFNGETKEYKYIAGKIS